jgi:hypothetical protein
MVKCLAGLRKTHVEKRAFGQMDVNGKNEVDIWDLWDSGLC